MFLPQKEVVVLQWLFDYLSDKKHSANRVNFGFWDILYKTWNALSKDQDTLSRIYLSNNFVGILSDTFVQATIHLTKEEDLQTFLTSVTNALTELDKSNLWFKLRSDNFIHIIDSYAKFVIHVRRTVKSNIYLEETSVLISNIIKSTLSSSSDVKKMSPLFNSKALGNAFVTLSLDISGNTLSLYVNLISSLITTADDKTLEFDFKPVTDAISSYKLSEQETEQSTVKLFRILADSWPNKSPNAFSQLLLISPSALKQLVSVAADKKIKIDSEFLESTISQIFGTKDTTNVDWGLLEFIHNIDESFLTEEKWLSKILSAQSGQKNTKQFKSFAKTLIEYFSNSRELPQFILAWKQDLDSSCWNDTFVSEYLSIKVGSLSNIQLQSLLSMLTTPLNNEDEQTTPVQLYLPIITCVLSFFQQPTLPSSTLFGPLFSVLISTKFSDSSLFWTLKYLILSISSGFVTKFQGDILEQAKEIKYGLKGKDDELAESIMQTIFRISELEEVSSFGKYVGKLLKYIGKKSHNNTLFFDSICDRWLLLVNTKFSKKHKEKLISLFATDKAAFNKICATELFYEQKSLSPLVFDQFGSKSELKKEIARVRTISEIPLQAIKITRRRKIIDSLTSMAISKTSVSADDLELQLAVRKALDHLLSYPTLTVGLVSDHEKFQKYFSTCAAYKNNELGQLTLHTCQCILKYHNKNYAKSEASQKFLKKLVEQAVSLLDASDAKVSNELNFATMVVSVLDAEVFTPTKKKNKRLDHVVIERLGSSLKGPQDVSSNELRELFDVLHPMQNLATLSFTKSQELSHLKNILLVTGHYASLVLKQLANGEADSSSTEDFKVLAQHCFTVLSHVSSSQKDIETLIAYHIAFLDSDVQVSLTDLVFCLGKLGEDELKNLLSNTVASAFQNSDVEKARPFTIIKTTKAFLRVFKDEEQLSVSESLCTLLLRILENTKRLTEEDVFAFFDLVEFAVKDRSKLVTPFILELTVSIFVRLCTTQFGPEFVSSTGSPDLVYTRLAEVASSAVVFNRSRLSGRYHILTQLLTALLGCLTNHSQGSFTGSGSSTQNANKPSEIDSIFHPAWITLCPEPFTEKSGEAYTRLISNLSSSSVSYKETSEKHRLTSYTQTLKRHLSLYIGVVLINYVRFSMQEGFSAHVRRGLVPGFYMVFNTIGHEQLKNVNLQLDANSRPYFKTLYEDYIAHGKWRSD